MRIAELFDLPKQAKREREIRDREIQKTWAPARQAIF